LKVLIEKRRWRRLKSLDHVGERKAYDMRTTKTRRNLGSDKRKDPSLKEFAPNAANVAIALAASAGNARTVQASTEN
jgi:hypothetical protein